jgi:hypothetical protein
MDTMVYYSDNPDLGIKTVTTAAGEKEYRRNCKPIKGQYYVINKTCFLIGDTWYRVDSGLIAEDAEKGGWFLLSKMPEDMMRGYVSLADKKIGYFSRNPYKNVVIGGTSVISEEVALDGGYVEDKSTGMYVRKGDASDKITNALDHTHKGYNIEDNKMEYPLKIKLYDEYPTKINEQIKEYAALLGDTTFGAELECQKGYLPNHMQARMGIVVCRDGSLKDEKGMPGPEFVTIPLKGEKGIQTLVDICKALSIRTEIGLNCSLHLHLGNINTDRRFMVGLYRLCHKIQNEIFQMFPYYKANPDGIKHKNYNQKLPTLQIYTFPDIEDTKGLNKFIDLSYRKIFLWLAEGHVELDLNLAKKVYKHPSPNKWERHMRYFWMNSMNVIFSDRNTIEFRVHTPTTNAQKVFNWLFICNAIVRFAEENAEKIITTPRKITLSEILRYYTRFGEKGQTLSEYLISYVRSRKEEFYRDYEKGDYVSKWDITEDKSYVFPFQGIENMFK